MSTRATTRSGTTTLSASEQRERRCGAPRRRTAARGRAARWRRAATSTDAEPAHEHERVQAIGGEAVVVHVQPHAQRRGHDDRAEQRDDGQREQRVAPRERRVRLAAWRASRAGAGRRARRPPPSGRSRAARTRAAVSPVRLAKESLAAEEPAELREHVGAEEHGERAEGRGQIRVRRARSGNRSGARQRCGRRRRARRMPNRPPSRRRSRRRRRAR